MGLSHLGELAPRLLPNYLEIRMCSSMEQYWYWLNKCASIQKNCCTVCMFLCHCFMEIIRIDRLYIQLHHWYTANSLCRKLCKHKVMMKFMHRIQFHSLKMSRNLQQLHLRYPFSRNNLYCHGRIENSLSNWDLSIPDSSQRRINNINRYLQIQKNCRNSHKLFTVNLHNSCNGSTYQHPSKFHQQCSPHN